LAKGRRWRFARHARRDGQVRPHIAGVEIVPLISWNLAPKYHHGQWMNPSVSALSAELMPTPGAAMSGFEITGRGLAGSE